MSITVAISHHVSNSLSAAQWDHIVALCDEIIALENARTSLLEFLQSMMHTVAPNTTALIGASVCAKLIAASGSLLDLSRTPACNI
jgi:RNA processing factor Prp31